MNDLTDLKRRAGITEEAEGLGPEYIPQAINTAKADIGSIVSFDASDIIASLKQTMGDLDDALEVLGR